MTNVLTSTVIKEHLDSADKLIASYLWKIDSIYEDADLEDANVVLQLKQLMDEIAEDVRMCSFLRIREWMITYIYTLCEDITT